MKIGYAAFLISTALLSHGNAQTKQVVAYFPEWGVEHHPPYYIKQIESSGAADKLTVLIYAFSEPAPDSTGAVQPQFKNAYEAYQQMYSAEMSIDGVADDSTQPLRGQFNQLKKLKARHPKLKVLVSIGGWTGSGYFSDALSTQQSREKFADEIINRYILGNLPIANNAGGKGVAAGIFNGIDIDWEYPLNGGMDGNHHDSSDNNNLSAFYALIREKLDFINRKLLITAAVPASKHYAQNYNIGEDQKYLNWYNVMTYDFVGEWSPATNHHTNLLTSPNNDSASAQSFDNSVRYFMDSLGVKSKKIIPGAAFYGHGWRDVDTTNAGLYQPAGGSASRDDESESRNYSYWASLQSKGYEFHWDSLAMAPWLYSQKDKIFWSFDDARSIALKKRYADAYHLGGLMCWEISGDDSAGTLISAMNSGEMPEANPNAPGQLKVELPKKKSSASFAISIATVNKRLIEGCNVIIKANINNENSEVIKVEFFVDGKSIGYDAEMPFEWIWFNARHGTHKIKAIATDRDGNRIGSNTIVVQMSKMSGGMN